MQGLAEWHVGSRQRTDAWLQLSLQAAVAAGPTNHPGLCVTRRQRPRSGVVEGTGYDTHKDSRVSCKNPP